MSLYEDGKVLLATYGGSTMEKDGDTRTFYRFKSYAKPEEMLLTRKLWNLYMEKIYQPKLLWLPQHMVKLGVL